MGLLKGQCVEWRKARRCIVAIKFKWKLVGRLYGMYISAKRQRSIDYWEKATWKTFWATFRRTDCSIGFIGQILPCNCEGPVKSPSIWKERLTWIVPRKRIGCRPWGVGDDVRIGSLLKKDWMRRGDLSLRKWHIYFWIENDWDHPPNCGNVQFKESFRQSEGSLPPPHNSFRDAGEAINDFSSMFGDFIYRHHVEPRVKLYSPREDSFPLKFVENNIGPIPRIIRVTCSMLNVFQISLFQYKQHLTSPCSQCESLQGSPVQVRKRTSLVHWTSEFVTERQAQQHVEWTEPCGNSWLHPMIRGRRGLSHSWASLFLSSLFLVVSVSVPLDSFSLFPHHLSDHPVVPNCPTPSIIAMWWRNTLHTSVEDFGTLAENEPPTVAVRSGWKLLGIPWNFVLINETSKICYLMGWRLVKDFVGNHLKNPWFHLVHWLSTVLWLQRISHASINLEDVRFYTMFNFGHFWAPFLVTLVIFTKCQKHKHPISLNHVPWTPLTPWNTLNTWTPQTPWTRTP